MNRKIFSLILMLGVLIFSKRNEPAFVVDVAKKISEIRGETLDTVASYTTANAENLYKIGVE